MTAKNEAGDASELRVKLESQFGIRWAEQRERETKDLEQRPATDVDITDVLNGETHFFRFPFYLDVLKAHWNRREDHSIPYRIHSAACSTGEEVYSVAYCLTGPSGQVLKNVEISGSDARGSAIEIAKQALYGRWSLRGVPAADQEAFLAAEGSRFRVREPYRAPVRFFVKNLLDPYEERYDAIFLCNATLYMTGEAAQKSYRQAAAALRPHGLLFVAPTDPTPTVQELGRHLVYLGWPIFGRANETAASNQALRDVHAPVGGPAPTRSAPPPASSARRATPSPATARTRQLAAPPVEPSGSKAVLDAWAKGELASVAAALHRLVFLAPDHALWRFLNGCLQWEQGLLRRARKELDAASVLASALPDNQELEGLCTAADLRKMIDYRKGEVA
ncbi:MAG: CheR family methyltransferase [Vicinamibacteria bacterium]